ICGSLVRRARGGELALLLRIGCGSALVLSAALRSRPALIARGRASLRRGACIAGVREHRVALVAHESLSVAWWCRNRQGTCGLERGSDWRLKNSFVPWAGSRLFDNAPCRRWIEAERRRS